MLLLVQDAELLFTMIFNGLLFKMSSRERGLLVRHQERNSFQMRVIFELLPPTDIVAHVIGYAKKTNKEQRLVNHRRIDTDCNERRFSKSLSTRDKYSAKFLPSCNSCTIFAPRNNKCRREKKTHREAGEPENCDNRANFRLH